MDQVVSACALDQDRRERIIAALRRGIVLVDANGQIVWMDDHIRRRVNGGLQRLNLPLSRADSDALDGFIASVDVMINGERTPFCVIQERDHAEEPERDMVAAIHSVMADTSWFTRTIIEKLKALRQTRPAAEPDLSRDADILSDREREVLGLICEGRSDGEISKLLHLSPNTVRNHLVSLYRKLGVNRRSAAIIWARERGITCREVVAPKRRRRPANQDARAEK
jgi:DNA-binding CsgD family transcriptional regulator